MLLLAVRIFASPERRICQPDDEPEDSGPSLPHHGSSADDPDRDETSASLQARKKRRVDDEDDSEVMGVYGT